MAPPYVILVDSDVLIAHLRGVPHARDWLREARETSGQLTISAISVVEITGGMRSAERPAVWRLLATLRIEDVNEVVARRAGEFMRRFRRSHPSVGVADYVIAATADTRGLTLATLNTRHYPMFAGLGAPFRLPS